MHKRIGVGIDHTHFLQSGPVAAARGHFLVNPDVVTRDFRVEVVRARPRQGGLVGAQCRRGIQKQARSAVRARCTRIGLAVDEALIKRRHVVRFDVRLDIRVHVDVPRCRWVVNGVDGHLETAVAEVDDVPGEVVCVTWFPGYNGFLQCIIHLHRCDDRRVRIQFV